MAFPVNGVLDDYNRVNENPATTNWTCPLDIGESSWQVLSNAFAPNTGRSSGWYDVTTYGPDMEAYVTLATMPAPDEEINLFARLTSPGTTPSGYLVRFVCSGAGNDIVRIRKIVTGSTSALGADITSDDFIAGDGLGIEVVGSTISAYRRSGSTWSLLGSRTDTDFSSAGYIALDVTGTTVVLDNLGGGTLAAGEPESASLRVTRSAMRW